jgi:ABC-type glycerol-3-phosphate transport system permease component
VRTSSAVAASPARQLLDGGFLLAVHLVLMTGAVITVWPFLWMVLSSFKTTTEVFRYPPALLPDSWDPTNFVRLFTEIRFPTWYANSLLVSTAQTLAVLFFASLAGFAFGKYDFKGSQILFSVVIASMIIPFHVIVIPMFVVVSKLGMLNQFPTLVLPWMAPPFGIFLMKQFMSSIPSELLDSARIDGAQEFRIYTSIVLPLLRPALGALAIYTFLGAWNGFLWPLVVMRDTDHFTLPVGMATLIGNMGNTRTEYGMLLGGASLISLPVIALFILMQKQFTAGLTLGSVKE